MSLIQQLADHIRKTDNMVELTDFEREFAQLIINVCAKIADDTNPEAEIGEKILQNFGLYEPK